MSAPRRLIALSGEVRAITPDAIGRLALRLDRASLETVIEQLIGHLDAMDPDPDLEPSLGAPERHPSNLNAWDVNRGPDQSQVTWSDAGDVGEREDVSEDEGACIQDQPHDEETDDDQDLEDALVFNIRRAA